MSIQAFMRANGLRHGGKHHVFFDRQGNPVVIQEQQVRSDFRGEGDLLEGDFGRMGNVPIYAPAYMGDAGGGQNFLDGNGNQVFQPNYMDGNVDEQEFAEFAAWKASRQGNHGGRHGPQLFHGHRGQMQQQITREAANLTHVNIAGAVPDGWAKTMVAGSETLTGAGQAQLQIRLQHDFLAEDIAFTGTVSGAEVTAIYFADRLVWDVSEGVDVSTFATTGFVRNFLNGQRLRAGLDIRIVGTVPGAGKFKAVLTGSKPYTVAMGT